MTVSVLKDEKLSALWKQHIFQTIFSQTPEQREVKKAFIAYFFDKE